MKIQMKFEESPLSGYLVKNLQPLTEADPALLANYVVALLKNNKPKKELQKLCVDKLYDFLGDGTKSFVTKLFHALEDGSILTSIDEIEDTRLNETRTAVVSGGPTEVRSSSPQSERLPSAAVCVFNELEEKEISDDDDDDRNHKHRRVTRSHSFDRDDQGDDERRPNKKRGRHSENGQSLQESEPQFSGRRREYTPSHLDTESSLKYDKRWHGSSPSSRLNMDGGQKLARASQTFCNGSASRFDGQNPLSRAGLGRGRGRSTVAWAPHDSRFTSVETVEFASSMPPQRTTSTNLYPGTGRAIPNNANTTNLAWNGFGMLSGLPSGGLEQLQHPLHAGMHVGRGVPLSVTVGIDMGMGHPRCRDFEERGFCLRGDMCPMEHGLNRIVVEDVQSLSQFNLPVSLPSGHLLGMKSGAVGGHSSAGVYTLTPGSKSSYINKFCANVDTAHLNGMPISSAENEPDFYDPDQLLWNKDRLDSSCALIQLLSPGKGEEEHLWDDNSSDRHSCRLSDGDNERPCKSTGTAIGSHNVVASVWGRIGPVDPAGNKSGVNKSGDASSEAVQRGKFQKKVYDEQISFRRGNICQRKCDIEMEIFEDTDAKCTKNPLQQGKVDGSVIPGLHVDSGSHLSSGFLACGNDSRRSRGKGTDKAVRTLFVNCIPPQSNRKELLLSHFQKFGEVLDIHIPKNSERAFVQFRHRDGAEAALASPDAVMGNRFIRLSWANRDSMLAGGESSVTTVPGRIASGGTSNSQPQKILAEKGKEKVNDVGPAVSGISTLEASPTQTGPLKSVATDDFSDYSTPSISNVQKNQEKLELLEALRWKQEMLAQKRDNFRRQLDKLEKQGIVCKLDALDTDQDVQHEKSDPNAECSHLKKSCNAHLHSSVGSDSCLGAENLVKGNCGDASNQIAGSSLLSPAMFSHTSPKAFRLPFLRFARLAAPPVFSSNRYKLDNRPTAFKILPPLPAGLMDISVLKEHFVVFGDVSSVEFDDVEGHVDKVSKTEKCSVCVTYTTRRAAERAFGHGKSWQGQNLQFAWLVPSNSTISHTNVENPACQTSKGFNIRAIAAEKEAHVGVYEFDNELSAVAVQVEKETSDGKEVNVNGTRNGDNTAEVSMDSCGHQFQNLNDEGSQSDPALCLIPLLQANTGTSKLDDSSSNINNFVQTDIPTEVL